MTTLDKFHVCRKFVGQGKLFIFMKFCPILCQICVENMRKFHVLINKTCRKLGVGL